MKHGDEIFEWGWLTDKIVKIHTYYGARRDEQQYCFGYMARGLDRRFWHAYFSEQEGTPKRDGQMYFDGNCWRSEGGKVISIPRAVIDDFGQLVPVAPYG